MPLSPSDLLKKISKKAILSILFLFLGFFALGVYGWVRSFHEAGVDSPYQESFMRTLQMITNRRPVIVSEIFPDHWATMVSWIGLKAMIACGMLVAAIFFLRNKLAVFNFRKTTGHTIIIGINEESKRLITYFIKEGHKVAVIEENTDHPDIQSIEDQGVLVIPGNPEDENVFKNAQLKNAGKVIVAISDESKSIIVAEGISKHVSENSDSSNEIEVLVRVKSDKLMTVLEEKWRVLKSKASGCKFRLINFQSTAIREIISEIAMDLCQKDKIREEGPSFLIVADSALSDQFLRQAIIFIQISEENVPSFTVQTDSADNNKYFQDRYPDIGLVADVNFINCTKDRILHSDTIANQNFDALIVCLENELETIGLVHELLNSNSIDIDEGYAVLRESPKIDMDPIEKLKIIALAEHGTKSPEFGDFDMEKEAEDLHNAYLAEKFKNEEIPKQDTWDQLSYSGQEGNRLAVLHHRVKRKIWEVTKEESKDRMISLLACSEHQRWKAEKILSGWKGGSDRDNKRKIHEYICPYSEVPDDIKEYDVKVVKNALGLN